MKIINHNDDGSRGWFWESSTWERVEAASGRIKRTTLNWKHIETVLKKNKSKGFTSFERLGWICSPAPHCQGREFPSHMLAPCFFVRDLRSNFVLSKLWFSDNCIFSLNYYSFHYSLICMCYVQCTYILTWFFNFNQCGQNIMGPKHHLKAQKHQPKTPPKNLKKHHFLGKKHHIFFKNLSKMTLPWIFIAFLCINFWKIFTVKLKFSKNF